MRAPAQTWPRDIKALRKGLNRVGAHGVTNFSAAAAADDWDATSEMKPKFFETPADFRRWLEKYHASETELWVGFYKKSTGKPSITWPDAVDQALCFGWIDGVRKTLDAESYTNRFTPRRRGSNWSLINIRKAKDLIESGLMQPVGKQAFEARDPAKEGIYLFEQQKIATLPPAETKRFKANKPAWQFFESQPPGYRKLAIRWVLNAKLEATRDRRLARLIYDSAAGRRLAPLATPGKR